MNTQSSKLIRFFDFLKKHSFVEQTHIQNRNILCKLDNGISSSFEILNGLKNNPCDVIAIELSKTPSFVINGITYVFKLNTVVYEMSENLFISDDVYDRLIQNIKIVDNAIYIIFNSLDEMIFRDCTQLSDQDKIIINPYLEQAREDILATCISIWYFILTFDLNYDSVYKDSSTQCSLRTYSDNCNKRKRDTDNVNDLETTKIKKSKQTTLHKLESILIIP